MCSDEGLVVLCELGVMVLKFDVVDMVSVFGFVW